MSLPDDRPADRPPMLPDPDLYPDLATAGGLAAAITQICHDQGISLNIQQSTTARDRLLSAAISTERGSIDINIGAEQRWFIPRIWWRGVQLTSGSCGDLTSVVAMAARWAQGASLTSLHADWPYLKVTELALAHEAGNEVAVKWDLLRRDPPDILQPLVEAAFAEPKLRALFPFTSHLDLHFSRCTGFPYSWDVPFVQHLPGHRYLIAGPTRATVIGEADDAEKAIQMVIQGLPADCGPAVPGTAEDPAG